ncbi:hypothetical protein [Dictyobacter arantiisoli]|uniref:Uncharacterized protein n=1 Tax=Dictyobacter arantiisoli TaxID=2014874 RepID=A0A5A5TJD8_9CHLR|nr:hypothetical protein [Dictyobacter arantiisoli]GCF11348.1 hypothetical protein KDI_49120 [Dictyobacter arantiisoli]
MEPQRMYEQRQSYESTFSALSYEKEKVGNKNRKSIFIVNGIFQIIIIVLGIIYSMSALPSKTQAMSINMISLNVFLFILVWILPRKLRVGRRIVYSSLIFIASLILCFISVIVLTANGSDVLLIVWGIFVLLVLATYWLAKSIPEITF